MRKILTAAALALGMLPLKAQDTVYKITGTVPSDVKTVYIIAFGERVPFDSVSVAGGKFELSGTRPLNDVLNIIAGGQNQLMFNDGTPVDINTVDATFSGSELNKKLYGYDQQMNKYIERMETLYMELSAIANDTTASARQRQETLRTEFEQVNDEAMNEQIGIIKANKDNLIPAAYLGQLYYALDYNTLKELLPESAPYYNHPAVAGAKMQLAALEKRMPGKTFTDLTMNDTEGKERKLSEWCGKGNYVLIDFWASWCGPCRQEMPNVVANYEKYRAKGFQVVGVSFDNNAAAWKSAVKSLNMEWPNISDLKGWKSAAASVYGITAIPANVLLDGDGKIVAADLRGNALSAKLKEVYGE